MKKFEQKIVKVGDTDYTLQHPGARSALEMKKKWTNTDHKSGIDDMVLYEEMFKNVVVKPKVSLDDFVDPSQAEELGIQAFSFVFNIDLDEKK